MGSRIMHYCITSIINRSLEFTDTSFYLGGLAPDLHSYMGPTKYYVTHFAMRNEQGETCTKYDEYIEKYLRTDISPFHLGYYFHLISDDIWKREIYYKKIKGLDSAERKEALQKNYRDFWRLNGMIIAHYSLRLQPLTPLSIAMDEIDSRHFPKLISAFERDFELSDEASGEELELLNFAEVLHVLDRTVQICLDAYSLLKRNDRIGGKHRSN